MKIDATISANHGAGGPMETAIRLAKAAKETDLEKLEALGRCLCAAAKAERQNRKNENAHGSNQQTAGRRRAAINMEVRG